MGSMTNAVPSAWLKSDWSVHVLKNQFTGTSGVDLERRWAGDLLTLGLGSDAIVSLAILRDEEWIESAPLVRTVLKELSINPEDPAVLLRCMREAIAFAIEGGADPRAQITFGFQLAAELAGSPGENGELHVFYFLDDELGLIAEGVIQPDPKLLQLGVRQWSLNHLRSEM